MGDIKRTRGRPKRFGNLVLEIDVLEIHERLRKKNIGRNEAIKQTITEVLQRHQGSKLSQTGVKNILSKFQPEKSFLFQVGSAEDWRSGTFRVKKDGNKYTLKFEPRPQFQKRGRQFVRNNILFGKKISKQVA